MTILPRALKHLSGERVTDAQRRAVADVARSLPRDHTILHADTDEKTEVLVFVTAYDFHRKAPLVIEWSVGASGVLEGGGPVPEPVRFLANLLLLDIEPFTYPIVRRTEPVKPLSGEAVRVDSPEAKQLILDHADGEDSPLRCLYYDGETWAEGFASFLDNDDPAVTVEDADGDEDSFATHIMLMPPDPK